MNNEPRTTSVIYIFMLKSRKRKYKGSWPDWTNMWHSKQFLSYTSPKSSTKFIHKNLKLINSHSKLALFKKGIYSWRVILQISKNLMALNKLTCIKRHIFITHSTTKYFILLSFLCPLPWKWPKLQECKHCA